MYFTPKGHGNYMPGFTPYVRISDSLFNDIKSGNSASIEMDTPNEMPHTITRVDEEKLPVLVDEHECAIRTIKATTDNGWTFWIMDNPSFPIIVKGEMGFKFGQPMFSHADLTGKEIVHQLGLGKEVTTHSILFGFNSADINPESKPVLDQIREYLKQSPKVKLQIEGHTDNVGTAQQNLDLSKRRADSVKNYFCENSIVDASRLSTDGLGMSKPIADNSTASGRQRNRRVVFRTIE
jgi:outer membrane protein OmpA-like peptidoglycan-associated protein